VPRSWLADPVEGIPCANSIVFGSVLASSKAAKRLRVTGTGVVGVSANGKPDDVVSAHAGDAWGGAGIV
jgi:hypothetical protein